MRTSHPLPGDTCTEQPHVPATIIQILAKNPLSYTKVRLSAELTRSLVWLDLVRIAILRKIRLNYEQNKQPPRHVLMSVSYKFLKMSFYRCFLEQLS